ncbi:DUF1254 domain-containing protein [Herbiconiux sp. CPCC 205763]|uniref:DUF1254 domain-containing protein n=1 Tax=Herbiconiux aconitum TaxID=2970913 RepID=A0ABT2GVT6_9MICO|nr:DUF1254 domain-containing protein [Herbiconiux aconitum]MCS5718996.1 DUF1254 domain-containing protein [Herbiconiux aconitum]
MTIQSTVSTDTVASLSTPDHIESRIGRLEFTDGAPTAATAELLYDHLDFVRAVEAFINAFPGASVTAVRRGLHSVGVEDNSVIIFSDLMDSSSLFLTANCDTVYAVGVLDLTKGPMVVEVPALAAPSGILGTADDMWFRWITDMGLPGPDRAAGGSYLFVGPDYDGSLPDSGFHVSQVRTSRMLFFLRAFLIDNDPSVPAQVLRDGLRVHPYTPGGVGTAVGTFLRGEAPLGQAAPAPETRFVEGSGLAFNTIPANDFSYWELINELVQDQPVGSGDPELLGLLASIGISKGKEFAPDARMRKILEEAVVVGNATARTIAISPREEEGWAYYPGSGWMNPLFTSGYDFLAPPPEITPEGAVPVPSDGARKLNGRIAWFYPYTGVTPAMCMRLTGIGSQYIFTMRDGDKEFLDGGRAYKLTLPPDIPQSRFWSVMVYDRQTRSMLKTGQPKPDLSSQLGTVAQNENGSTDIYFAADAPAGKESNWLQTVPGKGFFVILRLYNPLQPFFDKSWRPTEIERI